MFAVVRTGGKQYEVSPGDVIVAERLAGEAGATIELGDVLMVSDGATTTVGTPTVAGAKVAATVIDQSRGDKIVVLKFKRRKKYRRTTGHRQEQTVLRVMEISAPGMATARAEEKKAKKAPEPEAADAAEAGAPEAEAAPKKKAAARKPAAKKPAAKAKAPAKGKSNKE